MWTHFKTVMLFGEGVRRARAGAQGRGVCDTSMGCVAHCRGIGRHVGGGASEVTQDQGAGWGRGLRRVELNEASPPTWRPCCPGRATPKPGPPAPASLRPSLPGTEWWDPGPLLTLAASLQSWRPTGTWCRVPPGAGTEPCWARHAR